MELACPRTSMGRVSPLSRRWGRVGRVYSDMNDDLKFLFNLTLTIRDGAFF
jgi:hypothetical protein